MTSPSSPPSPEEILSHLVSSSLFSSFEPATLEGVSSDLEWVDLPAGSTLISQGDVSDALYIVVSGRLEAAVTREDNGQIVEGEVTAGMSVGEIQLLTGEQRMASVYAVEDSKLVKVPKTAFDQLAKKDAQLLERTASIISRRLRRKQLVSILPNLCGEFNELSRQAIEQEVEWVRLSRGEVLLHQGDSDDDLYVLVSGRLKVTVDNGDSTEQVGEVIPGESVGEMAMFTGERRAASVYAARDSELVKLSKTTFDRIAERHPQVSRQISGLLINRLRKAIRRSSREEASTNLVLVAADPGVPLAEFALHLTTALKDLHPTLHLSSQYVDSALGLAHIAQPSPEDPKNLRLTVWLHQQEVKYRFIVYESDLSLTPWTRRCLRQADQVLIVGRAWSDPTPGEIEKALLDAEDEKTAPGRILVLTHPDQTDHPAGTERWLNGRTVEAHYHVRWGRQTDFERLARILAGRAVGLVLGGGGARGLAHIGIIRALREANIPIDLVGGTSTGALISGGYALGWDHETIIEKVRELGTGWVDPTLPIVSVFAGRKAVAKLKATFGDTLIEDLWLPYFCVSSNLTRAQIMVHRRGLLWQHTRASMSLPGILPPVYHKGDLLVDGGMLNNLPVDIMDELCRGGTVIAVDVSASVALEHNSNYGESLSGWKVAWRRINPFAQSLDVPNIAAVLSRSGELASAAIQKNMIRQRLADLYIRPPIEQFEMFQFDAIDKIEEVGYRAAKEKLAGWQSGVKSLNRDD